MKIVRFLMLVSGLFVLFFPYANASEGQKDQVLDAWVSQAAPAIMTFSFKDFDEKKQMNKSYFTNHGYDSFYKAMEASRIPEVVKSDLLSVSSTISCGVELILKPATEEGKTWEAKFPMQIDYLSANGSRKQYQNIMLIIKQDKQSAAYGIDQWVATSLTEAEAFVCGSKEQKKARIGELRREIAEREAEMKVLEKEIKSP